MKGLDDPVTWRELRAIMALVAIGLWAGMALGWLLGKL